MNTPPVMKPLERRCAGVLLHPSSLPGPGFSGDFGTDARRFVDLIVASGLRIWQLMPLGPTHVDLSPYQSFSVHAGNPDFIDLDWLVQRDWLSQSRAADGQACRIVKQQVLAEASVPCMSQLKRDNDSPLSQSYQRFLSEAEHWLEDHVRFQVFREELSDLPWPDWPVGLRSRDASACDDMARELSHKCDEERFRQFVFHCQWQELREYANSRGILIFGDMPIYVHLDSADVWSNQALFDLDEAGCPITITGVPPDYFSTQGQLWGNPQYNWERLRETGFHWWLQRFETARRQFDIVRIDHFRGLQAYWSIAAEAESAIDGHWVNAPGGELLELVRRDYPDLCLVAENLGSISAEVEALRKEFSLPGMLILQFAFDGNPNNPYLPHNHQHEDIVYTGTHDNNTSQGWFDSVSDDLRRVVYDYFSQSQEAMPWMLIRQAMASVANTAIIPWQDFLGLDGSHRMNTPGTADGNWRWRFGWEQVPQDLAGRIGTLLTMYNRHDVSR